MAKSYIKLWDSYKSYFEPLGAAEVGRLVLAMMDYKSSGVVPEFTGSEKFIWPAIKRDMDEDAEYTEKKASSGRAGGKGKLKQTEASESTLKQTEAGRRTKDVGRRNKSSSIRDETMTTNLVETEYEKNIGRLTEKQLGELMDFNSSLGEEIVLAVIFKCRDLDGRSWAYVRKPLKEAEGLGCRTVEEYNRLCPIGSGRSKRVGRETPNGNDFLKNAAHRKSLIKKKNVVST